MTKPVSKPREAFFPPLRLNLSTESEVINSILYSGSASSVLGKGARLQLYIKPDELPSPLPAFIHVMIYIDGPQEATAKTRVYALGFNSEKQRDSFRYDPLVTGWNNRIGKVYLPKLTFSDADAPPERCWLEVTLPAGA
jgi:hypothetical protein